MCDMQKKHPYRIGSAIVLPSEETLLKVTVTVMINDCTTISISDMSAVFKYYMVKNKSDTLPCDTMPELKKSQQTIITTVQTAIFELAGSAKFLHFTILGVHRPHSPPNPPK